MEQNSKINNEQKSNSMNTEKEETLQEENLQEELSPEERALRERALDLERQKSVASIESECLMLGVGSSKTFELFDYQAFQNIRARFWRLKSETGIEYKSWLEGNNIVVMRVAGGKDNAKSSIESNTEGHVGG